MRIYDVTLPISAKLPVWPGDPPPELTPIHTIARGDQFNLSAIRLGTHTGTHVDAPRHIFAAGATVDQIPVEILVGEAWVCHLRDDAPMVTASSLDAAAIPQGTRRLLLRTRNSTIWAAGHHTLASDYVALAPDAAQWVVDRGIALLGIDYLSVDPADAPQPVAHQLLLSNGVVLLECLDLRAIEPGSYLLCCLPLKLVGADAAPARVLLARSR